MFTFSKQTIVDDQANKEIHRFLKISKFILKLFDHNLIACLLSLLSVAGINTSHPQFIRWGLYFQLTVSDVLIHGWLVSRQKASWWKGLARKSTCFMVARKQRAGIESKKGPGPDSIPRLMCRDPFPLAKPHSLAAPTAVNSSVSPRTNSPTWPIPSQSNHIAKSLKVQSHQ